MQYLMCHFTHVYLPKLNSLDAYLKVPWKHLFATAQVIKEYVPEDVDLNQLSISKGQHLIVVSKEGDENGWWKGRFNDQVCYFSKLY